MVFLTLSYWIRNRGPDRYWKVQEVISNARKEVRAVRRAFVYATKAHKIKQRNIRTSSVEVNRRVLSDLAITEPKSFLSLAKLARVRQQEGFGGALGNGKEPPGVFSHIVTLQ
ncbi:unnamed protein product [Coregonus sp. 'balchen']|nr:unnamed protein product [Coregonus sp. 'balchen']